MSNTVSREALLRIEQYVTTNDGKLNNYPALVEIGKIGYDAAMREASAQAIAANARYQRQIMSLRSEIVRMSVTGLAVGLDY